MELELRAAGLLVRGYAWLLDALIRAAVYFALAWILSLLMPLLGTGVFGVMMVVFFIMEWFYPVLFEVYTGTTPGKKRFKLYVCHDDGTPVGWQASITRNFIRVADMLPVAYGFAIMTALCNKDFKRLGDIAAGTMVVYQEDNELTYRVPRSSSVPLPAPLGQEDQRAILAYAERSGQLSEARCDELAEMLQPYVGEQHYAEKETLIGYANTIAYGAERAPEDEFPSKLSNKDTLAAHRYSPGMQEFANRVKRGGRE